MTKLNFHVHANFNTYVNHEADSLEAARAQEAEAGGDGGDVVAFVSIESANEAGLGLLESAHYAMLNGGGDSALEELAGKLFKAGVEYAQARMRAAIGAQGPEC
jgi:hypothetical protein